MIYGRALAGRHNEALDALDSCLSASHEGVRGDYAVRLLNYQQDLLEIVAFWDKPETQDERFKYMRFVFRMFENEFFNGFDILKNQQMIEAMRKRIKGKLLFTRSLLADNDAKPACLDKANHVQICKCKNYAKSIGVTA